MKDNILNGTNYDMSLIDKIREKDLDFLSDQERLEKELLPELGFNNEMIEEYPRSLHEHCGKGLYSWQYPNQFSKYLVHLSQMKIESYLEIGVRHGGTFIITLEYLNKFHPIKAGLAVDIISCPLIEEYISTKPDFSVDFWKVDSCSFQFESFSNYCSGDLTFIDGNHCYHAVESDYINAKKFSKNIVLHDISNRHCRDVNRLWQEVKGDTMYETEEFTDQYLEFKNRKEEYFGIGLLKSKDSKFIK